MGLEPGVKARILVVEDDETARRNLVRVLKRDGHEVMSSSGVSSAKARLERAEAPDLVLTDLVMEDGDGLELLSWVKHRFPETEVIVITGYGSVPSAIQTMKKGAYHYLEKPFRPEELRHLVEQALEKRRLQERVRELESRLSMEGSGPPPLIGQSREMREVSRLLKQVAQADCNVLITGESGTGKELAASLIHHHSRRAGGKFLAINCGGFTEELLASELFGHEKGAFTGAESAKPGLLEAASGGTLFLDEIGDMPLSMQVKLLRAVQEQEVLRVGGREPIPIDIRIIAATNQDLKKAVAAGLFRQDLYFRLNVITIHLPPLRERKEDIPLLAHYFLARAARSSGKSVSGFSEEALAALMSYDYPGNVRELENIVEHAVALAKGENIQVHDLPSDLSEVEVFPFEEESGRIRTLREIQRDYIEWVLKKTGRNKSKAAKLLGIDRASLWRHLKRREID